MSKVEKILYCVLILFQIACQNKDCENSCEVQYEIKDTLVYDEQGRYEGALATNSGYLVWTRHSFGIVESNKLLDYENEHFHTFDEDEVIRKVYMIEEPVSDEKFLVETSNSIYSYADETLSEILTCSNINIVGIVGDKIYSYSILKSELSSCDINDGEKLENILIEFDFSGEVSRVLSHNGDLYMRYTSNVSSSSDFSESGVVKYSIDGVLMQECSDCLLAGKDSDTIYAITENLDVVDLSDDKKLLAASSKLNFSYSYGSYIGENHMYFGGHGNYIYNIESNQFSEFFLQNEDLEYTIFYIVDDGSLYVGTSSNLYKYGRK